MFAELKNAIIGKRKKAISDYGVLVATLAAEKPAKPDDAHRILLESGHSIEKLEADVELKRRRLESARQLAQAKEAELDLQRCRKQLEKLQAEFESLVDDFERRKLDPVRSEVDRLTGVVSQRHAAESFLRQSCQDEELLATIADTQSEIARSDKAVRAARDRVERARERAQHAASRLGFDLAYTEEHVASLRRHVEEAERELRPIVAAHETLLERLGTLDARKLNP